MSLKVKLTIKYMVALAIIVCVLSTSYYLITDEIHGNKHDGYIINLSGKQRMLSQRIGFLTSELIQLQHVFKHETYQAVEGEKQGHYKAHPHSISHASQVDLRGEYNKTLNMLGENAAQMAQNHKELVTGALNKIDATTRSLAEALTQLEQNHTILINSKAGHTNEFYEMSDAVRHMYFAETGPRVDQQVREYVDLVHQLLLESQNENGDIKRMDLLALEITKRAKGHLLPNLNAVVMQYEEEYDQSTQSFMALERTIYLIGLSVIFLEALLIFRPMVRNIVDKTQALEEANNEMQSFALRLMQDIRAPLGSTITQMGLVKKYASSFGNDAVSTLVDKTNTTLDELRRLLDRMLNMVKLKAKSPPAETLNIKTFLEQQLIIFKKDPNNMPINILLQCQSEHQVYVCRPYFELAVQNMLQHVSGYLTGIKDTPKVTLHADVKGKTLSLICASVHEETIAKPEGRSAEVGQGSLYLATEAAKMMGGTFEKHSDAADDEYRLIVPIS